MKTNTYPRSDARAADTKGSAPTTLRGDCGVVLQVHTPCPDDDGHLLHCGCGAEILPVAPGNRCGS